MKTQKPSSERNLLGAMALGLGLAFGGLTLGACSDEPSAEDVGEEIDDAVDDAADAVDDAANEVEDAVENR